MLAVPRREQIGDVLHPFVAQLRGKAWRFALRETVGRHRTGDVFAVADRLREYTAEAGLRERRGGPGNAARVFDNRRRAGSYGFQRGDAHHQRVLLALQQARRLYGETRGVWESEIFVEAAREDGGHVRVT